MLPNQLVDAVRFDARGHLLVTHREATPDFESDYMMDLSIFAASDLEPRSTTPIDAWASLNAVVDGKALGREISANPDRQLRLIKGLLRDHGPASDLNAVQRREGELLKECYASAEHKEAVDAFLNKRTPAFR